MKDSIQSNQRTFKQNSYWLIGVSYNIISILLFLPFNSATIYIQMLRYIFWAENITEPPPKLVQHTNLSLLFFSVFPTL